VNVAQPDRAGGGRRFEGFDFIAELEDVEPENEYEYELPTADMPHVRRLLIYFFIK
jgi:hypothetical protein